MLTIGIWVALLILWAILSAAGVLNPILFPSPAKVLQTFLRILRDGYAGYTLLRHLGISFFRLFVALILAILTGVPLGLLSGSSPKVRAVIDSFIQFYRPLPPLAYYTLLILWLGIDESSKITLLFLAAFAPIYLAGVSAVQSVPNDYLLQASSLGANRRQLFLRVVLPTTLPAIFVGIRTAVGIAYTTLVSSEMVAATRGIGWMVIDASRYLRSDVIFVGILVMGLTGLAIDYLLRRAEAKFIYWGTAAMQQTAARSPWHRRLQTAFTALLAAALLIPMLLAVVPHRSGSTTYTDTVRIGVLRVPNDEVLAQTRGLFEEHFDPIGVKCEFMVFDSGVDANKALSSGSIDFATMGHTNGIVALASGMDVELIWIHEVLGDVEALVARNGSGIQSIADLKGKRVATPFASTSHLSLLTVLQQEGIDQDVTLMDMQTADIVAAWKRGDIDAAYTWQPTLSELIKDGETLITSADVAAAGTTTANILLVRRAFAEAHRDWVVTFLETLRVAGDVYREQPREAAEVLAKELDLDVAEVETQMSGSIWVTPDEQIRAEHFGTKDQPGRYIDTLMDTATFLYEGGYIDRLPTMSEIRRLANPSYIEDLVAKGVQP